VIRFFFFVCSLLMQVTRSTYGSLFMIAIVSFVFLLNIVAEDFPFNSVGFFFKDHRDLSKIIGLSPLFCFAV
jgi:hypothetical protein